MCIHNLKEWPKVHRDDSVLMAELADVRHRQGRLLGRMEGLRFRFREEAKLNTLASDVIKSSAIEGEQLNPDQVRSSFARRLGIAYAGTTVANRNVEGVVEMTLNATQRFQEPLTMERSLGWHAALFPTGYSGTQKITVGAWRTPEAGAMHVMSGPYGRETVHFGAPKAKRLNAEMTAFLNWFETDVHLDPVLKAGVAHLWFVTIHIFEDAAPAIC